MSGCSVYCLRHLLCADENRQRADPCQRLHARRGSGAVRGGGHLHPHHRDRKIRPRQERQLEQLERLEYRQRRLRRQLRRKILRASILTTAAAFAKKAAAGLLSEFFVMALGNVLLFRGGCKHSRFLYLRFFPQARLPYHQHGFRGIASVLVRWR